MNINQEQLNELLNLITTNSTAAYNAVTTFLTNNAYTLGMTGLALGLTVTSALLVKTYYAKEIDLFVQSLISVKDSILDRFQKPAIAPAVEEEETLEETEDQEDGLN